MQNVSIEPATYTFTIRCYEADRNGHASLSTFADLFQEAASSHAAQLGFSGEAMWNMGLAWVLSRLMFTVHRYPVPGEIIHVSTWPAQHEGRVAQRCYTVLDDAGELIAQGTSAWVVIHIATRRIAPLPDIVKERYPKGMPPCTPFASRAVARLREHQFETPVITRKADLDMNGHVNNARYVDWITESVSEKFCATHQPVMLDISFRAEALQGQTILSRTANIEPPQAENHHNGQQEMLHVLFRQEDTTELTRAKTIWRAVQK